jgi:hypothetical protein
MLHRNGKWFLRNLTVYCIFVFLYSYSDNDDRKSDRNMLVIKNMLHNMFYTRALFGFIT